MSNHLTDNPGIDAVTSRLSADSPSQDFFSEYKNIYMNFVFSRLPYFVDFLYGSFFGLRSPAFTDFHLEQVHFRAHDTAWGLQISSSGGKVALLKDLEVVHLKKYTFRSIIHNDFQIPYDWADIFISFKKWRDIPGIILRRKSFAHASTLQLATICLAYGLLALLFAAAVLAHAAATSLLLAAAGLAALAWLGLNRAFFSHIHARKGVAYLAGACAFTFVDNITMGLGIVAGLLATAMGGRAAAPPGLEERV
jgi:GT2 family glycosyltransferase